jgi:ABC-2 type transport system ATP-binding protein
MIEVEHLTKYYGDSPAVRDVTFSVERGEILGFLGPNGAGKTTTMRIITGYLPPTSGKVTVAGFDVAEKSLDARRHLGYLPETVPLYTDLTTYEYLDFRARICGMHSGRDRKARVREVMDELNIGDVSNKLIGKLSRGYRQRVGLAQAILHNPDVLILDEPTVGLDPIQITEVRSMIKELGRNHTVILSTHLLPEVSMVCNRVVIINRGRLVALDTPLHLAQDVSESNAVEVQVRGDSQGVLKTLRGIGGVVTAALENADTGDGTARATFGTESRVAAGASVYRVETRPGSDLRPSVAAALVGAGFELLELRNYQMSLEDIFLRVVSRETDEEELVEGDEPGEMLRGEEQDYDTDDEDGEPRLAAQGAKPMRVAPRRPRR